MTNPDYKCNCIAIGSCPRCTIPGVKARRYTRYDPIMVSTPKSERCDCGCGLDKDNCLCVRRPVGGTSLTTRIPVQDVSKSIPGLDSGDPSKEKPLPCNCGSGLDTFRCQCHLLRTQCERVKDQLIASGVSEDDVQVMIYSDEDVNEMKREIAENIKTTRIPVQDDESMLEGEVFVIRSEYDRLDKGRKVDVLQTLRTWVNNELKNLGE